MSNQVWGSEDVLVAGMCEVRVIWGMNSGGWLAGKREGIEVLMRDWRVWFREEWEGGMSQREGPGIFSCLCFVSAGKVMFVRLICDCR